MFKTFFVASFLEQQASLSQLLHESHIKVDFYFLLALASFITTLGMITDDVGVTVGGIFIAPLLLPLLSLAMGIVTMSALAIGRATRIILKSSALIFGVSLITAFLFSNNVVGSEILLRIKPDLIMLLIAFASGVAVAYSWVKQDLSAALPGVAVSVSLLPPLAAAAIGVVMLNRIVVAGALTMFMMNLAATVVGAILVFSLYGFARLQREEEEKIAEEKYEEKIQHDALVQVAKMKARKKAKVITETNFL
ncbi:MAG: hypothetical protein A2571_01610 [Candidatus Vogelbacteria bacterium RIFOXYD1_FULL_44_32]|uniref:TIGR00341 family protein n=1 Tax=Candidatus Vogelbacteria bacterium RIFOXYD1_FULL_44_32 TaxID=1802438 RepID=A0A1G2QD17_9BACT|nr:MAG: hypothetical protein A2571_01610 [Candidatus Vogelbacteria bacterium RIFOXYD1_FULL_44_32]